MPRPHFSQVFLASIAILTMACRENTRPPGPPTRLEVVSNELHAPVRGQVIAQVRVVDERGKAVGAAEVSFEVVSGEAWLESGGGVFKSAIAPSADDGVAAIAWDLGPTVGDYSLRATIPGLNPVLVHATATSGAPFVLLKFGTDSQAAPPSTALAVDPTVQVVDPDKNPCAGVTVLFVVKSGGGSIQSTTAVTSATGVASPGHWTLGPTKGINELTATVTGLNAITLTATAGQQSSDILVRYLRPVNPYQISGDQVELLVSIFSHYTVASVTASVGANSTTLTPSTLATGAWGGMLSLEGVPRDTVQILVTAIDIQGSITEAFVPVIHDRKPTIVVHAPLQNSVVRTSMDFSADCLDDDPRGCTTLAVKLGGENGNTIASGTTSVSGSIAAATFTGNSPVLAFIAFDSRNQRTVIEVVLWVDGSTHLTELLSGIGLAWDYRGGRLLIADSPGKLTIRSVNAPDENIVFDSRLSPSHGYLTATGAIFTATLQGGLGGTLFDWRNGNLNSTMPDADVLNVSLDGRFADYRSSALYLRDMTAGDLLIANATAASPSSVASNGDVAFWDANNYDTYWYHNGSLTRVTDDLDGLATSVSPVTDGSKVVYLHQLVHSGLVSILAYDGTSTTELAGPSPAQPGLDRRYSVNAGWTAFTKPDMNAVLQVWTRSPSGELRQVSFFGRGSQIDALGDDGAVVFTTGEQRYLALPSGTPIAVSTNLGRVVWREGMFVDLLGRSAFQILQ